MSSHNAYQDGKARVRRYLCATCIFRPGNLTHLGPRRLADLVGEAQANESATICHSTLVQGHAVCRGFYDRRPTRPLQIAGRLGLIDFDDITAVERPG